MLPLWLIMLSIVGVGAFSIAVYFLGKDSGYAEGFMAGAEHEWKYQVSKREEEELKKK